MTKAQKIREVKILAEKIQRLTGKKVVLKESSTPIGVLLVDNEEDDLMDSENIGTYQTVNDIESLKKIALKYKVKLKKIKDDFTNESYYAGMSPENSYTIIAGIADEDSLRGYLAAYNDKDL